MKVEVNMEVEVVLQKEKEEYSVEEEKDDASEDDDEKLKGKWVGEVKLGVLK